MTKWHPFPISKRRASLSPLGWSVGARLLWAAIAATLLWLSVAWALGW